VRVTGVEPASRETLDSKLKTEIKRGQINCF
jgi:hypothetical protein